MAADRVRWGIIGVGDVTERKSGPAFQLAEGSELVAVMRRTPGLAEDYARRHGVGRWYSDADALIGDPEIDAVYIATPPSSHQEYAVKAAEAGKAVYVEKPMGRTAAECEAMIAAADRAGVPLYVAYYRRAMPRFGLVRELIHGGEIGPPRAVVVRGEKVATENRAAGLPWRVIPAVSGGGHFVDLASHTLDLLDWLFGPITGVAGNATNTGGHYDAEDRVTARFGFESGVEGVGTWHYDSYRDLDSIEVVGSRGSLAFSCFGEEPLRLVTAATTREIGAPYPEVVQLPLVQAVVDALTGRGPEPASTGRTAIRTARVVDAVLASYRTGQS